MINPSWVSRGWSSCAILQTASMNNQSNQDSPRQKFFQLLKVLNEHRMYIIMPALVGMILAAIYAVALRKEVWSARQSLTVRDDLLGRSYKPGRFESLESMKSAQETILEIARKPQVIRNALKALGPESTTILGFAGDYPSDEIIETVQGNISFSAPNGAEFGTTEVINLNTTASSRERSRKFINLLMDEIIAKVGEVRISKFQSMATELELRCSAAEKALEASKQRLREMDLALGEDAAGMSAIGESSFRDDPITREIAQLNLERRAVKSEIESAQNMRKGLLAARANPEAIVNIPNELAIRQPELNLLKQELVKLKGELTAVSSKYKKIHPKVEFAKDAIVHMQTQIRMQLGNALRDAENQIGIHERRIAGLDADIDKLKSRLVLLGKYRADGVTLLADVKKRTDILNDARSELASVQGWSGSKDATLLNRVGKAQVSTRPNGMGKKYLVLAGGLGGLLLGLGWVMLIAPYSEPEGVNATGSSHLDSNSDLVAKITAPNVQVPNNPTLNKPIPSNPLVNASVTEPAVSSNSVPNAVTPNAEPLAPLPNVVSGISASQASTANSGLSKPASESGAKTNVLRDLVGANEKRDAANQGSAKTEGLADKKTKGAGSPKPAPVSLRKANSKTPLRKLAQNVPTIALGNKAKPFGLASGGEASTTETIEKIVTETFEKSVPRVPEIEIPKIDSTGGATTELKSLSNPSLSNEVSKAPQRGFKIGRKTSPANASDVTATMVISDRENELATLVRELKGSSDQVSDQQDRLEKSLSSLESFVDEKVAPAVTGNLTSPTIASDAETNKPKNESGGGAIDEAFQQEFKEPQAATQSKTDKSRAAESAKMDALKRALGSITPTTKPQSKAADDSTESKPTTKRPVDLTKSTETKKKRPLSENPFLKNSGVAKDSSGSADDEQHASVPVPDQIKKLSESIASFAKPFRQKRNPDKENF